MALAPREDLLDLESRQPVRGRLVSQPQRTPAKDRRPAAKTILQSRLVVALTAVLVLIAIGTIGYWMLGILHAEGILSPPIEEAWSPGQCLYMSVITISSVGYGEVFPIAHLPWVRTFTVGLILVAMLLVAYAASSGTAYLVDGDLQRMLIRRRDLHRISRLRGHYVVCGCGVAGRLIASELVGMGHRVVVIDKNADELEGVRQLRGAITIHGDATNDTTLLEAGVQRAAGMAIAIREDKENVFTIITVRQMNPRIRIVSQASSAAVQGKLLCAGADATVASSYVGGLRLVSELIRPAVVGFLDLMLRHGDSEVRFAEVQIGPDWCGKALGALAIERRVGLPVLAIKPSDDEPYLFNPSPELVLQEHAKVVTMGSVQRVTELERLVGDADGATILGGEPPPTVKIPKEPESVSEESEPPAPA